MGDSKLTSEHVAIVAVTVIGVAVTAGPISDNSILTHIRTGVDMTRTWKVPGRDAYSYTASGEPWIVQSWLAELTYGLLQRAAGYRAIIFEQMVLTGAIAFTVACLARAGSMERTVLAMLCPIVIGVQAWTARPLLFGVLGFALVVLVVDRRRSPWWLLPIAWLWVNTHGSFPLGVAWLGLVVVGAALDDRGSWRADARYLIVFLAGVGLGAVNPIGPKLLFFWTRAIGDRAESFARIGEWQSPNFHGGSGVVLLASIVMAVLLLLRRRPPWRDALTVTAFVAGGLYSTRHLAMLAIALAPALGRACRGTDAAQRATASGRVLVGALAAIAMMVPVMVARVATDDAFDFDAYPVASIAWLDEQGLRTSEHRLLSREVTGNYLEFRHGADARVFIDDRIDMYPAAVSGDFLHLLGLDADPEPILERYDVDVVLWRRDEALAHYLAADSGWVQVHSEKDWVTYLRRS